MQICGSWSKRFLAWSHYYKETHLKAPFKSDRASPSYGWLLSFNEKRAGRNRQSAYGFTNALILR